MKDLSGGMEKRMKEPKGRNLCRRRKKRKRENLSAAAV